LGTYTVSDTMHVSAPIDRCFLLSTSIDLAAQILQMRPVSGKLTGLLASNDEILWYGWKFGMPQMHESLITAYDRPNYFQDTMGRGRFKRFQHEHSFSEIGGHTLLQDKIRFSLPLGWIGDLVAKHLMVPYIASLLHRRLQILKKIAESDGWEKYLQATGTNASSEA